MDPSGTFWAAFWTAFHTTLEHGPFAAPPQLKGLDERMRLNPGVALNFAAQVYGLTVEDLMGRSRKAAPAEARAMVAVGLRKIGFPWSYPAIGKVLGGRDHTTVMFAARKGEGLIEDSERFAAAFDDLEALFNSISEGEA